ncbi:MAG: BBE domain-containing protein [Caldilineaceae bacterium]
MYSVDMVWDDPADSARMIQWAREYINALQPYSTGGLYSNFAGDIEPSQAAHGRNHQRLVEIKTKYDPTNFFRMNQNIKPVR